MLLTEVAAMSGLSGCDDKEAESDKLAAGWHSSLSALTENPFIRLVGIESIPGGAMAARMPDSVDVRSSRKGKTRRGHAAHLVLQVEM